MQKVMFTRTQRVAQGDGKGPVFEKGKAYWMLPDSADYWRALDAVVDAPADMQAENDPPAPRLGPSDVRMLRLPGGGFDVVGPDGHKFNREPLNADGAERLRKDVLDGKAGLPVIGSPKPQVAVRRPDDALPIHIRAEMVDGKRILYAEADWPTKTTLDADLLAGGEQGLVVNGDLVTISVANGEALYRIEPAIDHVHVARLIQGKYEPASPPHAQETKPEKQSQTAADTKKKK